MSGARVRASEILLGTGAYPSKSARTAQFLWKTAWGSGRLLLLLFLASRLRFLFDAVQARIVALPLHVVDAGGGESDAQLVDGIGRQAVHQVVFRHEIVRIGAVAFLVISLCQEAQRVGPAAFGASERGEEIHGVGRFAGIY